MRFKILLVAGFAVLSSLGFSQDINRASEWKVKRPEKAQAVVEKELSHNGVKPVKVMAPAILNEYGKPVSRRQNKRTEENSEMGASESVVRESDRQTQSAFALAEAEALAPEKEAKSPLLVGSVFLAVGTLIALAFRILTRKIAVPAEHMPTKV